MFNIKHGIFSVKCANCSFEKEFCTTNLDVGRSMKFQFNKKDSVIVEHMKSNEGHNIPFSVSKLQSYKTSGDQKVAFKLR